VHGNSNLWLLFEAHTVRLLSLTVAVLTPDRAQGLVTSRHMPPARHAASRGHSLHLHAYAGRLVHATGRFLVILGRRNRPGHAAGVRHVFLHT
jgi:hypothetical protein